MSIYVPNESEMEMLRAILLTQQWNLGLYKNVLSMDGSLNMLLVQEMPAGGGRTYAQKALTMDQATALAANKWYLSLNNSGKAEAAYHNTYLEWEFAAADVADVNTVQGVFAFVYKVPFDAGTSEIKVGDLVKGATSAATGIVTAVVVTSGAWGSNAAGYLFVKSKTGTFQNNENLIIGGKVATIALNVAGTGYAVGDIVSITQAGGSGVKIAILTAPGGIPATFAVVEGGQGYSAASALPTTNIVGSGVGLTLDISTLSTTAKAASDSGTLFAGDAHKVLVFLEELPDPKLIDTAGQKIRVNLKWTLSTS